MTSYVSVSHQRLSTAAVASYRQGSKLAQHFWCFDFKGPFLFNFLTWRQDCDGCTFEKCWLNSLPASGASCYCSRCLFPSYTSWSKWMGLFQQCYFQRLAAQKMLANSASSQLIFSRFLALVCHFNFARLLTQTAYTFLAWSHFAVWGLACTHLRSKCCDLQKLLRRTEHTGECTHGNVAKYFLGEHRQLWAPRSGSKSLCLGDCKVSTFLIVLSLPSRQEIDALGNWCTTGGTPQGQTETHPGLLLFSDSASKLCKTNSLKQKQVNEKPQPNQTRTEKELLTTFQMGRAAAKVTEGWDILPLWIKLWKPSKDPSDRSHDNNVITSWK